MRVLLEENLNRIVYFTDQKTGIFLQNHQNNTILAGFYFVAGAWICSQIKEFVFNIPSHLIFHVFDKVSTSINLQTEN